MKKDIKKLEADLKAKQSAGLAKLNEFNTLDALAIRTADQQAQYESLNTEIGKLESDCTDLKAEIEAEHRKIVRAQLFSPSAVDARRNAGADLNPERTFGFRNMAEFGIAVRKAVTGGGFDQRLVAGPSDFNQNAGAAQEGWLVPPQYRENVWEIAFDPVDLLGMVDSEPTISNAVMVPKDETTPWGSTGVQAAWRAEAGAMQVSKAALTGGLMPLHELYAFVVATSELLEDAPRLEARLTKKAGQAIRWKASDAIMWGDGDGKPMGYMNAGALVTVAKDSGQTASTVTAANLYNMLARLLRSQGDGSPVWFANTDIIPQLATLTIGTQPVWTQVGTGMQGEISDRLLGKPLIWTEHSQTLGTVGDISLVDPSGYYAARKATSDLSFATSMHLYFDLNMQAFRWTFRFGGQPYLTAPVAQPRSINKKSHFVALATRS